jgi:hypothetical protein
MKDSSMQKCPKDKSTYLILEGICYWQPAQEVQSIMKEIL